MSVGTVWQFALVLHASYWRY